MHLPFQVVLRAHKGSVLNSKNAYSVGSANRTPITGGLAPYTVQLLPSADSLSQKSHKTIEIVTVAKLVDRTAHQKNVAITLDENLIQEILSSAYQDVTITQISTLSDLEGVVARRPDLVFSGVKYFDFDGHILWLNDFLDLHGIAYMASSHQALNGEADKSHAKEIMHKAGIATARYFTSGPGEHTGEGALPIAFPLFVKPATGGDSRGVDANSIVHDFAGFHAKVDDIHAHQHARSLVESYLSGKEYSVGIFQDGTTGALTAMPIEITVEENEDGHRILDFDTKKNDSEQVFAVTDTNVHKQLSDLAKAAFTALSGRSFGRIDIKMNHHQVPHFMEANLMPGLRRGYFYRACALNLNISYEQMILKIAANGLSCS